MAEQAPKKLSPSCPNCGSDRIYRSRRNGPVEWALHYLLFQSPYRCQACNERFFRKRFARHRDKELHHPA